MKSILLVAYRQLIRHKTVSLVTIIGLGIGLCCCLTIGLFIKDELSFDKHHKNYGSIYRVDVDVQNQNETRKGAGSPFVLKDVSNGRVPGVISMGRMYQRSGQMQNVEKPEVRFQEQQVVFADNEILEIFSFDFLHGNNKALKQQGSLVLTEDAAVKYFGRADVKGLVLQYENKIPLTITAVIKNIPRNSDLRFDFLISFDDVYKAEQPDIADYLKSDWIFSPAWTFCLIGEGESSPDISRQLNKILQTHADERSKKLMTINLRPYGDIHLSSSEVQGNPSSATTTFLVVLGCIGIVILAIAGFNFVNLATARAGIRVREVGLRKVLGAAKRSLVLQFLGETMVMITISAIVALLFANFTLPFVNDFSGKFLAWSQLFEPSFIGLFGAGLIVTTLLSGLYPAILVSSFQTVASLKGKAGESGKKNLLRKILLTVQFTASVILLVCSLVIYKQLDLLKNRPLGYQKDNVLIIPLFGRGASIISFGVDASVRQRMNGFAGELKSRPFIKDVTAASELPGQGFIPGLVIPEGHTEDENIFMPWSSVDYNFLSALDIPLLAGRPFSKEKGTDHLNAFIINERALAAFDCKSPEEAVGKTVIRGDALNGKKGTVIGVVKDFNFNTLNEPVAPMIFDVSAARFTQLAVSIAAANTPQTIEFIAQKWHEYFPERVFEFSFLHDDIARLYNNQENLAEMLGYFTLIAVLLSCVGVLSLSAFLAGQRTREIGIRKVLGASVRSILVLLSQDFFKIGLIALLAGGLVAWLFMKEWLKDFHYRTDLDWWLFTLPGLALVLITVCIVCVQSITIVSSKPTESLRTE